MRCIVFISLWMKSEYILSYHQREGIENDTICNKLLSKYE